ncbi:hypothetical protein CEUSTIGMA_g3693.t1 [Chlamydomonas eustigma]|uniref:FAD-binding domain-containing protein n=1 Tax=Chlamydomonas eustigma TaxID=1157962 RepID=A0A250WZX4_9CHLO|nr:hypothetical protein CEUSTIGMA_g3693.t1 [Chlamydomonas eustigma]|eukprot:GAX76249.1 hypothetical protein CEUSTIGMA_g3693.t1 [Chlamydomonas eustigma]
MDSFSCRRNRVVKDGRKTSVVTFAQRRMTSPVENVLIIGAGPCGLAAAHALSKVLPRDTKIDLYEKAHQLDVPRGAGLGMTVNGLKSLRAIDKSVFDHLVDQHAMIIESVNYLDPLGKVLRTEHGEEMNRKQKESYGLHGVQVGWFELVSTLRETLPPNVAVHTGTRFLRYQEEENNHGLINVYFEGQEEPVHAGLLVAADGYFSRVRQQCVGDGHPIFGGNLFWRARVDASLAQKFNYKSGHSAWYFGDNRVALVFTISKGHMVWTASCPEAELVDAGIDWKTVTKGKEESSAMSSDFIQRSMSNGEDAKHRLLKVFESFDQDQLLQLFKATDPTAIVEHALYVRPASDLRPEWFGKGRVVIMGDAAHPMRPTGQGVNQGLEDALQLAKCIQEAGGSFEMLDRFRANRTERLRPIMMEAETRGKAAYQKSAVAPRYDTAVASKEQIQMNPEDFEAFLFDGADFEPLEVQA